MRYFVRKVPKGTSSVFPNDVWEVLKSPQAGDPYLLGVFPHPSLARWCLDSFTCSLEVQLQGGSVERADLYPEETLKAVPEGLPDELVW